VLLALGLSGWPKPRWVIGIALAICMSITLLAPFVLIQPAYARPIVSALPVGTNTTSVKRGAVELLGYQVVHDRVTAGEPIAVTTYWRKVAANSASPTAVVALIAPSGQIVGRAEKLLGTDAYPLEVWQPDDRVMTDFQIPAQSDRPTVAAVKLKISGEPEEIDLGQVAVWVDRACEIERAADVTFGGSIKLIGYRIEESTTIGSPPRVTLCWQALKPVTEDYTVFVHVPTEQGMITADAQPLSGDYPTSMWRPGEVVEDVHPLPAVIDLKIPRASIGLYRLQTGERLPIDGAHATEFELIK